MSASQFIPNLGVTYYELSNEVTQIAIEVRQKLFTSNFDVDLSQDIVSIDTGVVQFDPTRGISNSPIWAMTKVSHPDDRSFSDWMTDTAQGSEIRKDITLNMRLNQAETPVRTMICFDALPLSWNYGDLDGTGGGSVLSETIVVKCQRVELG